MAAPALIEKYLYAVRKAGLRTQKAVDFSGAPVVYLPAGTLVGATVTYPNGVATVTGGVPVGGGGSPVTSNSAQAFAVGPNGNTNPTFNVDSSVANAATGLNVQGQAAGGGLAGGVKISAISSSANEVLFIDAKGNGNIIIASVSTSPVLVSQKLIANQFSLSAGGNTPTEYLKMTTDNNNATISHVSGSLYLVPNGTDGTRVSSGGNLRVGGTTVQQTATATVGGQATVSSNLAVPAGGSAAGALLMSSTAALGVYFGSGAPTVSAAQGSFYLRTDGSSVATRLYVNTNGTTGWTAITTAT
jgi:hypothetical protein